MYSCTVAYTGKVTFYNVPEQQVHVYLVRLYLGIVDDEEREEDSSPHGQRGVGQLATDKHLDEASEDKNDEAGEEHSAHVGEVPLRLEGEGGETADYGRGQEEGLHHNGLVEEGG